MLSNEQITNTQTVELFDSNCGDTYELPSGDDLSSMDYSSNVPLGQFLERPVRIKSYTWAENNTISVTFNPWHAFFDNSYIKNKIQNYAFVNCKLKLKVVVNASPFYYGLAVVSYQPLTRFMTNSLAAMSNLTIIPLSQRPHGWIYPQTNEGCTMTLPFLYDKNWLELTSADDLNDMGTVTIQSTSILRNANSIAGIDVDIQVYCWAEDVKLSGPTYLAAVQSDEYAGNGMISKPASAVSTIAHKLKDVPVIGKYMKATEIVSSAISNVFSYFGFTNVPNIKDQDAFKPLPFGGLTSTEISTPIDKLTFDPKNELTIDNAVCGHTSEDELTIKSIATRESYCTSFTWTAAAVTGDTLGFMEVNPFTVFTDSTILGYPLHVFTPIAQMAALFAYWRGDIIYRIRFICSKFHRGRVLISWDPKTTPNTLSETYNFSKIVDITKETDIEIRVPYLQATTFMPIAFPLPYVSTTAPAFDASSSNGMMRMFVLNAQTSPTASADIQIAVSMRAADNIEFAAPGNRYEVYTYYAPPQSLEFYDAPQADEDELSYETTQVQFMPPATLHEATYLAHMGEKINSIRQILRRSTYVRTIRGSTALTTTANTLTFGTYKNRYPLYPGFDPNGIDRTNTLVPYNYVANTPFNWIANSFIGSRGSVHWHTNISSPDVLSRISINRYEEGILWTSYQQLVGYAIEPLTTSSEVGYSSAYLNRGTFGGLSLIDQKVQSGLSVSAPFYSRYKMRSNDKFHRTVGTDAQRSELDNLQTLTDCSPVANQQAINITFHEYFSIGTDFNFVFYLNAPVVLLTIIPPNPITN